MVEVLGAYLVKIGYKKENIKYVPISGLLGENLTDKSTIEKLNEWYKGPCLSDLIYEFKPNKKSIDKPIRVFISDSYISTFEQIKGLCVSGKVEGGVIEAGDKLILMPLKAKCTIKGIMTGEQKVKKAKAGEAAEIALQIEGDLDQSLVKNGMILSSLAYPVNVITRFKAQIMTFELQTPITLGREIILHCYSLKVPAKFVKLEKSVTGEIEKKHPKCLLSNQTAFVVISTVDKICLELYQNYKGLGRIAIRDDSGTLATGIITELIS